MDEVTRLLLTQLADGGDGTSMAEVVLQSLGDDPLAAPLAAALRRNEAPEEDADVAARDEADPELAGLLERLYAELEVLRRRNELVARALGACRRCFGEDELCPVCRGRGRPGGRAPDEALFAELVAPAVERRTGRPADRVLFTEPINGS